MSTHLTTKLDALMDIISAYEENPKKLDIRRLAELHSDLFEGYTLIANQQEHATALDRRIDHYLRTSDIGASTLRQSLLQLHSTWFFFQAGGALGIGDAYQKARELRGDTSDEGPYFRSVLVPRIVDPINSRLPAAARLELLAIIAKMENDTDVPGLFDDQTSDGELYQIPRTQFVLGLIRRWEAAGRQNLAEQAHTIENRLLRGHRLDQMAVDDPVLRDILGPKHLGYINPPPFWQRVVNLLRRFRDFLWALVVDLPGVISRPAFYALIGIAYIVGSVAFGFYIRNDNQKMLAELEVMKVGIMEEPEPEPEPEPKPPPPPPRDTVIDEIQDALSGTSISFEASSDVISSEGRTLLRFIGKILEPHTELEITIEGHTDAQGDEANNLALSQARAEAVLQFLVEQGIADDRLTAIGYGESRPIADNETREGREKNRRIEFSAGGGP